MRNLLALTLMVRADRRSWVPAVFWSVTAVISMIAASALAMQPGRLSDLYEVRSWLAVLGDPGVEPYAHFAGKLDYPPVALLVLLPIRLIPDAVLAYWFIPLSIATAALAGWVFVRAITERLYTSISIQEQIALVGLLLSTGGARTSIWLGQTVSLSVLTGALALYWSRRRPYAAALALALCSFKPHLGLGFGLAILMLDGLNVPILAGAIVTSLSLLVAAIVDQSVLDMMIDYVANLTFIYDGPDRLRGLLSIRWVMEDAIGNYGLATGVYVLAAGMTLVMIGSLAQRAINAAERTQIIAIILLWPLLFLPSQLYSSVLAAPALWLLMWPEGRLIRRESVRLAVVTVLTCISVLDVPRLVRFISGLDVELKWLYEWTYLVHPLRLALLFTFLLYALTRGRRRPSTGAAS